MSNNKFFDVVDDLPNSPYQVPGVVVTDPLTGRPGGVGAVSNVIPDYTTPAALAAAWGNFAGVNTAGGDFIAVGPGLNGQNIIALSGSPLTTGESFVVNDTEVLQPAALEIAASFVRTGISFATASLFANADTGPDPVPNPINITSVYQSSAVQGAAYNATAGTIITMQLETALPNAASNQAVFVGDWVNVTGLIDSRLNYANLCINYISPDRKTVCAGFSDESALPSLAVAAITPALGSAKVNFYNNMSGAREGFGLRLTGTSATSAAVVSIFAGEDNQVSGTLLGDHRTTIGTTAPNYVAGGNFGQYEIRANTRFRFECTPHDSALLDVGEQANATFNFRETPRTSVKPASGAKLKPRFRLYKPISMSRPIAKIVSAVKASASSTATITTDVDHNLTTGQWVTLKGARDFATNYPPISAAVQVTVTGARTFTATWGAAAIATTYGGSVIMSNGGRDQPGIIGQTAQVVQSVVAEGGNWLQVTGSANWSGLSLGDYIDLHGVLEAVAGADLGLDGAWEVANIASAVMLLKPITDIFGVRVSPALGTLGATNCGGSVIVRPTLRSHDLMLEAWSESRVRIDGQGTTRADKALPVAMINTPSVTISGTPTVTANEGTQIAGSPTTFATAASTNAQSLKAAAGNLSEVSVFNVTAAAIFVKLYNKASAPTVGTDVPIVTIPVDAGALFTAEFGRFGKRFGTGIAIAVTANAAATDATAVTAGAQVSLTYN